MKVVVKSIKAKLLLDIIGVDEQEQEETNNQVVSDEKEQKSEPAQNAPQQQAQKPQPRIRIYWIL